MRIQRNPANPYVCNGFSLKIIHFLPYSYCLFVFLFFESLRKQKGAYPFAPHICQRGTGPDSSGIVAVVDSPTPRQCSNSYPVKIQPAYTAHWNISHIGETTVGQRDWKWALLWMRKDEGLQSGLSLRMAEGLIKITLLFFPDARCFCWKVIKPPFHVILPTHT